MSNFDKDPRRKQEIKMRPVADAIYRQTFGEDIDIQRFDHEDQRILDVTFAIDVQLRLDSGQILLGQEKFLSHEHAKYRSLTVEHYQVPRTKEWGDWFKIATQFYFVGYCTSDMSAFDPWVLANWTSIVVSTNTGLVKWLDNRNKDGRARASFRYVNMMTLPDDCIIACSWADADAEEAHRRASPVDGWGL